jgi:hypothetical protein
MKYVACGTCDDLCALVRFLTTEYYATDGPEGPWVCDMVLVDDRPYGGDSHLEFTMGDDYQDALISFCGSAITLSNDGRLQ